MKSFPRLIRWLIEAALVGGAAAAFAATPRFPITTQQIADALAARGMAVDAAHVLLPMQMSSATLAPALEAGPPAAAGNKVTRVRISCRDRADCLPFYISVPDAGTVTVATSVSSPLRPSIPFASPALRAGARALLAIDDQRIHIRVQVIALENGEPGRTVRVTSLDHKQTFAAQVIDSTLVKGSL